MNHQTTVQRVRAAIFRKSATAHLSSIGGAQGLVTAAIAAMQREISDLNTAKGWRSSATSLLERLALVHSEISEAVEAYRDPAMDIQTVSPIDGKPEGVTVELADALIRILDICDIYGLDIAEAYRVKMDYNWTRPYRHGEKRA